MIPDSRADHHDDWTLLNIFIHSTYKPKATYEPSPRILPILFARGLQSARNLVLQLSANG